MGQFALCTIVYIERENCCLDMCGTTSVLDTCFCHGQRIMARMSTGKAVSANILLGVAVILAMLFLLRSSYIAVVAACRCS